ncbi:MAG: hypothetical protein ACR2J8_02345 [Thermomicrobiales bacterium]
MFDRITRVLAGSVSRRAGIRAALGAAFGFGAGAIESEAKPAHGPAHAGRPGAAGPCGNGSVKANRCTKGSECCTGVCNAEKKRCRCLNRGKTCKKNENCCNALECRNRKCTPPPPPPIPTGKACAKKDTCADAKASCTTYAGGDPAGTYCLMPYLGACAASGDCETQDCDGGKCISCSCPGCGGTCTPIVCPTCTFTTVQAAIDAATAGDIITIAPGTYAEDFTVSQTVTLKGCPGGEVVLKSATVPRRTIMVSLGFNLTLIDVIVDAADYQGTPSTNGGIEAMGDVTLCRNAAVRNGFTNEQGFGGGCIRMGQVNVPGITLTMNDQSVVENCTSNRLGHYGGGVFVDSYDHMVMNDSSVVRNSRTLAGLVSGGGGVGIYYGADLVMNDKSRITGNSSFANGGGVQVYSGGGIPFVLQMNDEASIDGNNAGEFGGGVHLSYGTHDNLDQVQMTGSATIANNHADERGGGIGLEGGVITMTDSATITGNSAPKAGGIFSIGTDDWTAAHSVVLSGQATVSENTVDSYGGGIFASDGLILLEDSASISGNTAGKDGGGVYLETRFTKPSSIEITESAAISGNTAAQGGGVFAVDANQTVTGAAGITGNTPDNCVGATGC